MLTVSPHLCCFLSTHQLQTCPWSSLSDYAFCFYSENANLTQEVEVEGLDHPRGKGSLAYGDVSWQFWTCTLCFFHTCGFVALGQHMQWKKINNHLPAWVFTCVPQSVSLHLTCESVCACVVPTTYYFSRCHFLLIHHVPLPLSLFSFCTSHRVCVLVRAQIISFPSYLSRHIYIYYFY